MFADSEKVRLRGSEIRRASNWQYYWRIVASNAQVLATSETYVAKASAISAAQSVQSGAAAAPVIDYSQ